MACVAESFEAQSTVANVDHFTPEFKRLKARKPPPDFEKVIDLHLFQPPDESSSPLKEHSRISNRHLTNRNDLKPVAGLKPMKEWKVFEFVDNPGFLVVLNPFIDGYQRYWVSRCLQDFPSDTANVTNMTGQQDFDHSGVWHRFKQKSTFEKNDPLKKLRWTTLGYHYDWNTKEYSETRKADFPMDVHVLSDYIAQALGFGQHRAEAAIVNYYHMDSTLAGHTDHSEIDLDAPLFSISFGQTAIFLLGGKTKNIKPSALYLRSGDICVMSGPSRLAYHAVPRILTPWTEEEAYRLNTAFDNSKLFPPTCEDICNSSAATFGSRIILGTEKVSKLSAISKSVVPELSSKIDHMDKGTSDYVITKAPTGVDHRMEVSSCDNCNKADKILKLRNANHSNVLEDINAQIVRTVECIDFKPFELYLSSSRINLNIRQVLPSGYSILPAETETEYVNHTKKLKTSDSHK